MGLDAVVDIIKSKDDFLIISHKDPDGDCIGSMLGLHFICKALGKTSVMVNTDEIPEMYHFLPYIEEARTSPPPNKRFKVALVVDCATLERMGEVQDALDKVDIVVNIDHHKSNEYFGDINLVIPEASASGEVVFDIVKTLGLNITFELATVLFTAISTDTGSFRFSNTTKRTFLIAAELMDAGAMPDEIADNVFDSKPYPTLKLFGELLSALKVSPCGQVSWASIPVEQLKRFNVTEEQTEGFINYVRMVQGVKISLLFRQRENGEIRVSWRSKGDMDVSNLAALFGGGGHTKAAGCVLIDKTLEEAEEEILNVVYDALKMTKTACNSST